MKVKKFIIIGIYFDLDENISLLLTSDNRYIISASEDKSMKIFDIQAKKQVYHFKNIHTSK